MSQLQRLREQRAEAGKTILQLRDRIAKEGRDFNSEERTAWDKANADFDRLDAQVNDLKRGNRVEKILGGKYDDGVTPGLEDNYGRRRKRNRLGVGDGADGASLQDLAMAGWFRRQSGRELTPAMARACRQLGFKPSVRTLEISLPNRPDVYLRSGQTVGSATAGGDLVPSGFVTNLEVALKEWNAVRRSGAEVIRTEAGNPLPWPTLNDTGNAGTLLTESTQVGEVDATFGQTTFNSFKFTSGIVLASVELEQDNAVGLVERMGSILGERVGRGSEGYFTTGTGSSQPQGIVTGASLGVSAASASTIAADEVYDLYHSVDPAYRNDPTFGFMAHDSTIKVLRKLKDSNGRYLWQLNTLEGLTAGYEAMLLGEPMITNQSMATIATTNKTLLAGAFSKFKIRDAGKIRVRRLVERYADYDQVGYVAFMRSDSHVLDAGTHPIKYLQQA